MNTQRSWTLAIVAAAAVAALLPMGCGGASAGYRFPVAPASGTITCQGKPIDGAIVRFHPADPAALRPPQGQAGPDLSLTTTTDPAGRFALSTYAADDGIPPGDYTVTVTPAPWSDGESAHPDDLTPAERQQAAARNRRPFAKGYLSAQTSPLKATVKAGGPNDFQLQLDPRDPRDNGALR